MKHKFAIAAVALGVSAAFSLVGISSAQAGTFAISNSGGTCAASTATNGNTAVVTSTTGNTCTYVQVSEEYINGGGGSTSIKSTVYGPKQWGTSQVTAGTTMVVQRTGTAWIGSGYAVEYF